MSKNVELKAKIENHNSVVYRLKQLDAKGPYVLDQVDSYVRLRVGRLKLRSVNGSNGEIIFYRRADRAGPKTSSYWRVPLGILYWPLRLSLITVGGFYVTVRKRRSLYFIGQTRVHVDEVAGLGNFLELEVVLSAEETAGYGTRIANSLMKNLGVEPHQLLSGSYSDMLEELHSNCGRNCRLRDKNRQ
ncbi:class IV adenylate cyclase [Halomonas cerina]|uniref:class IV adenylate cyclase n=1 Tax=Halomonas cerina TaxID=447424 RepID=UPI00160CE23D